MSRQRAILIVDDEPEHCLVVSQALVSAGYRPETANNGPAAIQLSRQQKFDLFLLDIRMQPMDGIEVLQTLRAHDPNAQIIMLSAFGDVDVAVKCMKLGAYDFLAKPINLDELLITVGNALKSLELEREVENLRSQIEIQQSVDQLLGESPKMQELMRLIGQVAHHDITVMIRGESGTGKELTARALHSRSRRSQAPFVSVDCAALPETLVESELFGYERGAFTGAQGRKIGRFEQAGEGTLFLDEIGNLSLAVQMKLLRALQERKFHRLGGKEEVPFRATVITATNVQLEQAIHEGRFREDLYYRLNEFVLHLPALRERGRDIPLLVKHFLDSFNRQFQKKVSGLSSEAMACCLQYPWPGNVRELRNVMKRAVVLADDWVQPTHLPDNIRLLSRLEPESGHPASPEPENFSASEGLSLKEIVKREISQLERKVIQTALETSHWNRSLTAKKLEIDYKTLYNKMKEYQID